MKTFNLEIRGPKTIIFKGNVKEIDFYTADSNGITLTPSNLIEHLGYENLAFGNVKVTTVDGKVSVYYLNGGIVNIEVTDVNIFTKTNKSDTKNLKDE